MKTHILKKVTVIEKNVEQLFDFFSKAENLVLITPPSLGFEIISKTPGEMRKGTIIDYKIRINGIAFKWRSEITKWDPPYLFEDTQLKGPYKIWIHEHKFEEKNGSTHIYDTVNYLSPGGIFEFIPHNLFVKNKVEFIFTHREKILNELFSK